MKGLFHFAVFHQQVLHIGLTLYMGLYLVHEHWAQVSSLMLPDGSYKTKLEYSSPDNLTEVVFIFYASMLTMPKK